MMLTGVRGCGHRAQVAVVKGAGTAEQAVWFSTLASVVDDTSSSGPLSPCVIVVGAVAGLPAAWAAQQQQQQQQEGAA